jgi:hypothetical protein
MVPWYHIYGIMNLKIKLKQSREQGRHLIRAIKDAEQV